MDLFYHSLPGERNMPFSSVYAARAEELTALQGRVDPLDIVPGSVLKPRRTYCVSMSFSSPILPTPCCWVV
ncbi:cell division protein ZapE [Salmonella enterica subsp. enterica serovar Weltevreden]|nr:cell division protein ZapE [Salmonella enterica subsp. enterica serovar Weltevreden]